jgi:hypothetical protein
METSFQTSEVVRDGKHGYGLFEVYNQSKRMDREIDLYQIFYNEDQRSELYDFAKPVFSVGLTPYFENQFIAALVPQSDADYISVCSWRLRKKRAGAAHFLGGFNKDEFSIDKIKASMPFDVAVLTPHSSSHKPLAMAINWHGKAWVDAYEAFKPFLKQFGPVPEELNHTIYENHFIARKEIYHAYVSDFLLPAIRFIGTNPVFFSDSNYLPKKKDEYEIRRVQKLLNRNDWPILPFLLERLFSFYINDKNLNVLKL